MAVVTVDASTTGTDALLETIDALESEYGVIAQAVDARYVADERHVALAWRMVQRARERDRMIADDPAMEWLLYVAGTRQIDRALSIGLTSETGVGAILIGGGRTETAVGSLEEAGLAAERDLGEAGLLREWFEVSPAEEAATAASLAELVHERVVLLQLEA